MTTQTKTTMIDRSREAKAGWRKVKLGDVFDLRYGFGLPEKKRVSGNIPVYGSSGIVGMNNKEKIKSPGIIIGRKGNVGSIYYSDKPFYPIDTVYCRASERKESVTFFSERAMATKVQYRAACRASERAKRVPTIPRGLPRGTFITLIH